MKPGSNNGAKTESNCSSASKVWPFDGREAAADKDARHLIYDSRISLAAQTCRKTVLILVICYTLLWVTSCGSANSSQVTTAPTIYSVTITPANATVFTRGTEQFKASVTGNGDYNHAVSWAVNGTVGGTSILGTISTTGLYNAPSFVPSPSAVSITASSVQDPSKSGTAAVTITGVTEGPVSVSVSPASATFGAGQIPPSCGQ